MLSKTWAALAVALILPFLHGCGDDNANQGQVRIVNATTAYSALDLYTKDSSSNEDAVVTGTATGTVSGYQGVDRGTYTFEVESSGSGVSAATVDGSVSKDDHFTVVAYLTGNALQAKYLTDDETHPSSGKAKLRVFNAANSEAGGVDVYLTQNECTALTVTDTALATNVTDLQTAFTQITAASAGTDWHVCVTATGDKGDLRVDVPKLTLKDQEIATLVLTRTTGGVLLNAMLLDQQGALTAYANSIARVRLVSDAATNGLVSATVNEVSLGADSASPSVSQYVTVPSGTVTATFQINDVAINGVTVGDLAAGSDYTLLVAGSVSAPTVKLLADDNTPSTSTSLPVKVRVVNGVNGGGTVSGNVDSKLVGSSVAFGAASSYAQIAATTGTSTVRVTIGGVTQTLTDQTFSSSGVYTLFVWGDATSATNTAGPQISLSADR